MSTEPEPKRANYASGEDRVVLRPHEYDGIQEYDQQLPNWWLVIFFGCLLAFPVYWLVYYQFGLMRSDETVLGAQLAKIEETKAKALQEMLANLDDKALVNQWAHDGEALKNGRAAYEAYCAACHAADLTGRLELAGGQSVPLPGLPLKDGEWKYGPKPMDVFKLIHDGTPPDSPGHNGARMEAWGNKLPPLQIAQLTAYIISENPADFTSSAD